MHLYRIAQFATIVATVLAAASADAWRGEVHAQGKLDARYTASLAGLPIGRGASLIEIGDDNFSATANGSTTGLIQVIASGQGQSAVRGSIANGQLVPSSYASSIVTDKKYDEVRMAISAGTVKDFVAEPASQPSPNRVPLTDAHRRGVSDPMTATLIRVPGNGNPVSAEACQRKLAVFDGRMRYDLLLAFKRLENVKPEQGYQGAAVVCLVQFSPIAGHIPDRTAIKYLADLRSMELWLAPIVGTRVLAPYRFSVPTPLGVGVVQATQFVSVAQAGRPNTTAKTQ